MDLQTYVFSDQLLKSLNNILLQLGKREEFNIGKELRRKYGSWLGNYYTENILEARSTDTPRTKMSLMLALAGLFPPRGVQKWSNYLNWQPIPFDYEKKENDTVGLMSVFI